MSKTIKKETQFFKCKVNDYDIFQKGIVYHRLIIGRFLYSNPNDWTPVMEFPSYKEILKSLETGENKEKIIKALKQWKNNRVL